MRVRVIQIRTETFLKQHELDCILRTSRLSADELESFDVLAEALGPHVFDGVDAIIIGGSGEFSATQDSPFHTAIFDVVKTCYDRGFPLLGLCYGHHIMARALGGKVITDPSKSETGTVEIRLLPLAQDDALLRGLPNRFYAAQGHNDSVVELPPTLENLASSERSPFQACRAPGRPFYGLQFHPELRLEDLKSRLDHYGYLNSPERQAAADDLRPSPPVVQDVMARFIDEFVRPRAAVTSTQCQ